VSLHLYLGRGLTQLGLTRLAVEAHRNALASDPGCFEASFAMAEGLARLERWDAAARAFRAAVALRPANVEAQGSLVCALYRSGRLCAAAAAMRRLIDLRPGEPELYLALGMIQCRMRRPWEAIRTLRWAARLEVPRADRRFVLGEALFGERQWREALDGLAAGRAAARLVWGATGASTRGVVRRRWPALGAILAARIEPPAAVSAAVSVAWRGMAARGHLLAARAFARGKPHRALRSVRAARRLGSA
jgi:tetratricopeptide (TPR) repeat protein